MKKFLAIVLSLTFVVCSFCVFSSAATVQEEYGNFGTDDAGIKYYNGLDFNKNNNIWAKVDENGKWVESGLTGAMFTDGETYMYGTFEASTNTYSLLIGDTFVTMTEAEFTKNYGDFWMEPAKTSLTGFSSTKNYSDAIDWSLSDDGEFMTLVSNSNSSRPGLFYMIDNEMNEMALGDEAKNQPEYVAIRYRNWSSASVLTFGFVTKSTNGGNAFMSRTTTDMDIIPNSGEWVTKVVSMKELNGAMGHKDNNGGDGWNGAIRMFAVFPFGYGKTDGTGAYESAAMDIDYIVIGSEEYCRSYKSELQKQEESVTSIKLVTPPTKTTYYVGDVVDLDGLQIEATYADGSKEIITNCSGVTYNFTTAADKSTVTLKYGSNTTPLTYDVKVIGISSIEITSAAETTTFVAGKVKDGLAADDIKGLKIKINYADGTAKEDYVPSIKNVTLSGTEVGSQIATVNYYGTETTYAVTLITVDSIKVETGDKVFHYGDKISVDDLTITVVYTDGSEKTLGDSGFKDQIKEIEANTKVIGEITFDVVLDNEAYSINVSASASVTIATPDSIKVDSLPTKTEYNPEEKLDTTGLVVKYVYADGTEVVVDEADYQTRYDFSAPGTKTVTIRSNGLDTSFECTVKGATTNATQSTQATTAAPQPGNKGCGSVIGAGSLVIIATVTAAGAMIIKKKEN